MNIDELVIFIQQHFASEIEDFQISKHTKCSKTCIIDTSAKYTEKLLLFLKSSDKLRFSILTDLFCVDFPDRQDRFEVIYNLLSMKLNLRLVIKINTSITSKIPSIHKIYSSATWYEREVFDMFGVIFDDAIDHRRILTDYDFVGYPLRKDFPVFGYTQIRYDEELKKIVKEPVVLDQDFREFDFLSNYSGREEILLPGDEKAEVKK